MIGVAFEMTRIALGIAERRDDVNEKVAKRIMEDLLCERTLQSLRAQFCGLKRSSTRVCPLVRADGAYAALIMPAHGYVAASVLYRA